MKVAIEGCAHGELENIYDSIQALESEENIKVNLLICCGDFQSVRNENDLRCMSIKPKYYNICSFYKYYSGEKEAPILTIFIGGNHEASNYLQELPFGGWVAPNIYYLGYAGVININGLRIGGISGIYKGHDYMKGHHEITPYSEGSKYSVYHIRNIEIFRLKQISEPVDIFLSHDWPSNITKYGNESQLIKFKPFFKTDIDSGRLGSPPCNELLYHLQPKYWFAAHLHCKFAALVEHDDGNTTKFLALDKCLPQKRFLQIIDFPSNEDEKLKMSYDLEWLTILHSTDHLFSVKNCMQYMPSNKSGNERWQFVPTEDEKNVILAKMNNDLTIPINFTKTAEAYSPDASINESFHQPLSQINPQTTEFCNKLGLTNPCEEVIKLNGASADRTPNNSFNSSFIEDTDVSRDLDTSMSPIKRISMSLPAPVNESFENEEVERKDVSEEVKESVIEKDEIVTDDKPLPKKFKRRNAEIYNNDDD